MRVNRQIIFWFLAVAVLLTAMSCAVNPVTGKKEIMLISEAQEIELGKQTDQSIRMQYGLYDDPKLTQYVRRVGESLTPHTHRKELKYHFAVLDTPVPNAFAAPGGYIYITRGLMAMMNSEAELAVVLGHELGHVNARHSARSMSRQMIFNLGLVVGSVLSKEVRRWAPLAGLAGNLLFLKFSRSDEYQADSLGIQYARGSRYLPGAMVTFFHSLQQLTADHGGSSIPNFLSTHPLTSRRIEEVQEMLQPGDENLKVARNDYLQRVNGLVYGNNPLQGYVEGNAFYHPQMRFAFNIPAGWKVQNTPAQVALAEANGNAVILLRVEKAQASLDQYAQSRLQQVLQNPRILDQGSAAVNALSAHHIIFDSAVTQDNTSVPMRGRMSCIQKNGMVYTFIGLTQRNAFQTYNAGIVTPIRTFRDLNDPNHLKRRPVHVQVVKANAPMTMGRFLSAHNIPSPLHKEVLLLNLMKADTQLSAGQLVKVIK